MKITFLGQSGLLFESGEKKILIDPYLSNAVEKLDSEKYRREKIDESFLKLDPDVIILTHCHIDHTDTETLKYYLPRNDCLVLAPFNAWNEVRKFGGGSNYIMFNAGTEWTYGDIRFGAVRAEHSDFYSIGVVILAEEKTYYVSGDTLYNSEIIKSVPKNIYAAFVCINGKGNNMNAADAKKFAEKIKPKYVVPTHFGLLDDLTAEDFDCENKIVPQIYKEIKFE